MNIDVAWELLRIQDNRYGGNMVESVKEIVEMSKEEYSEWLKQVKDE